jgi:hypothetical protein
MPSKMQADGLFIRSGNYELGAQTEKKKKWNG